MSTNLPLREALLLCIAGVSVDVDRPFPPRLLLHCPLLGAWFLVYPLRFSGVSTDDRGPDDPSAEPSLLGVLAPALLALSLKLS